MSMLLGVQIQADELSLGYTAGAPLVSEAWQMLILNDIVCLQKAQVNKVNQDCV